MTQSSTITCSKCGTQINKEEALYSQLQSKFEVDINIVDGFMQMQEELNKQKQKQIDTVLFNTTRL